MNPFWLELSQRPRGHQSESVWPFVYPQFVKELKESLRRLGVPNLVPYQARHSGASHDRLHELRSAQEQLKRGRWKSQNSLNRYEKAAVVEKMFNSYPAATREWILCREPDVEAIVLHGRTSCPAPPFA